MVAIIPGLNMLKYDGKVAPARNNFGMSMRHERPSYSFNLAEYG